MSNSQALDVVEATAGRGDVDQGQQFKHSPLPDASTYIRLLSLELPDAARDADAGYSLSTWQFEMAPAYHAVSYTWGPPDRDETIRLENKLKSIRRNCADVLRQIRHFRTAELYWIDTLCIDQDDIEEKSRQVAMMGGIYQRAEHVLTCVGMCEDENDLGLRVLGEYDKQHLNENKRNYTDYFGTGNMREYWDTHDRFLSWSSSRSAREILHLWLACNRLANSEYFARVWTTPEFLLARDVALYLGLSRIRWQTVEDVLEIVQPHYTRILSVSTLDHRTGEHGLCAVVDFSRLPKRDLDQLQRDRLSDEESKRTRSLFKRRQDPVRLGWTQEDQTRHLLSQTRNTDRMAMSEVVDTVYQRLCFDPRDTVYAMLLLTDQGGKAPILPDYSKTAYDLAINVVERHNLPENQVVQLLENLQLCRKTAEVELALQQRTKLSKEGEYPNWSASWGGHHGRISVDRVAGRRLDPQSEWRLGRLIHDESIYSVVANDTNEEVGKICANARSGDCLLKLMALIDSKTFHPHNLVVRPIEDRYVVVGLARVLPWCEDLWYHIPGEAPVGYTDFRIHFDPSDYVTYLASMMYFADNVQGETDECPASVRLNVGVCSTPFSSYAELKA